MSFMFEFRSQKSEQWSNLEISNGWIKCSIHWCHLIQFSGGYLHQTHKLGQNKEQIFAQYNREIDNEGAIDRDQPDWNCSVSEHAAAEEEELDHEMFYPLKTKLHPQRQQNIAKFQKQSCNWYHAIHDKDFKWNFTTGTNSNYYWICDSKE